MPKKKQRHRLIDTKTINASLSTFYFHSFSQFVFSPTLTTEQQQQPFPSVTSDSEARRRCSLACQRLGRIIRWRSRSRRLLYMYTSGTRRGKCRSRARGKLETAATSDERALCYFAVFFFDATDVLYTRLKIILLQRIVIGQIFSFI